MLLRRFIQSTTLAFLLAALASCPTQTPGTPGTLPGAPQQLLDHWLRFVHITDSQICDEESPARAIRFDWMIPVSWRPQENYGVQTLDATLRVINTMHEQDHPVDFLVFTGDLADGALHNELRWFLDTVDGQFVVPDSGEEDGAYRDQPAGSNPKLGYQAEGLHRDIPWYTVYGNHDELAVGTFAIDRRARDFRAWRAPLFEPVATLIGLTYLSPPQRAMLPLSSLSPAILRGSEELLHPETLQLSPSVLAYGPITPDSRRSFLSRRRFVEEHFNTVTKPEGHGFTGENLITGATYYAVNPKDDIPLRLIVLDTVAAQPPFGLPVEFGMLERAQFEDFLMPQLHAAHEAGEFVLIASHHPSTDFDRFFPGDTVGTREFREALSRFPRVIAHLCGHTHRHRVTHVEGAYAYLEIETGSLIDYPQEGRVFDLYYDPDTDRVELVGTMFSHTEAPTPLSAESFRRATVDAEYIGWIKDRDVDYDALFPAMGDLGKVPGAKGPRNGYVVLTAEERYGAIHDRSVRHRSGTR